MHGNPFNALLSALSQSAVRALCWKQKLAFL